MRAIPTTLTALALVTAGLAAAPTAAAQQFCGDDGEPPQTVEECIPDPGCEFPRECHDDAKDLVQHIREKADKVCDETLDTLHQDGESSIYCNLDGHNDDH